MGAHGFQPTSDLSYANGGALNIIGPALEWFETHLRQKGEIEPQSGVHTYIIGEYAWKSWEHWPPEAEQLVIYLQAPENIHNIGELVGQMPLQERHVTYTYDPDNPVPTLGGSVVLPGGVPDERDVIPGSMKQPEPCCRSDVVTFLSSAIEKELFIAGKINFKLSVSTDAEDTSFTVKVMEVFPDGEAYNIADGITTLKVGRVSEQAYLPGTVAVIQLQLWPIAWKVKKGSKIRVGISSSNYPTYHIHPNASGIWSETVKSKKAKQMIYTCGNHACLIEFPVVR